MLKAFISYSHVDKDLKNRFYKQLRVLSDSLEVWSDLDIAAGENWRDVIASELQTKADLVFLLLSPDFADSKECRAEAQVASELGAAGKLTVIPILLRPFYWQKDTLLKELAKVQILPRGAKAITLWGDIDEALETLVKEIDIALSQKRGIEARMPAARSQARAPLLESRVDRLRQVEVFRKCYREFTLHCPGMPQIYVIPGMHLDSHDLLIHRLYHDIKENLARAGSQSISELIPISTDSSLHILDSTLHDLYARVNLNFADETLSLGAVAHQLSDYGFAVIWQHVNAGKLRDGLGRFLDEYVNRFWSQAKCASGAQIIVFLSVEIPFEYPVSVFGKHFCLDTWFLWRQFKRKTEARLRGVCREAKEDFYWTNFESGSVGCPCVLLPELTPIDESDVMKWLVENGLPADVEQVERIFGQVKRGPDNAVHMARLREALQRCR